MNKPATIDFATATAIQIPAAGARTQALHDLVPGEARDSLLAVHDVLRRELPQGQLATYEAGGGSCSVLPLDLLDRSQVTVVDIDEDQVRNNTYADEAILGDVQTYSFGRETFDLVICYNVIEHLPHVDAALLNFRDALKRGGMILIGAPNPRSLSGVVTKYSPHWFHVWFYRNIRGIKNAGLPGEPPFPTFFHPLVTLPRLEAFARGQRPRDDLPPRGREPALSRDAPAQAAVRRSGRCRRRRDERRAAAQDRRSPRRLSRHPAEALTIMHARSPSQDERSPGGLAARGNEPLIPWGPQRHRDASKSGMRLNALFAISVNSPSMSMVNFPCCVDWAPISRVRGVKRRVTPQPAVVGMKAGDYA